MSDMPAQLRAWSEPIASGLEVPAASIVLHRAAHEIEQLLAALDDLRKSAMLLQQNAEGCAVNHYGDDFKIHGIPGWLVDTKASIDRAAKLLNSKS